jgi:hypothetical protein
MASSVAPTWQGSNTGQRRTVPLAGLLPLLELGLEVDALLGAHLLEHAGDARHHALEAAEVHVLRAQASVTRQPSAAVKARCAHEVGTC